MRKVLLLVASLLLAACGSGVETTGGNGATGTVKLTIGDSSAAKTVSKLVLVDATQVRFVITNTNLRINGVAYTSLKDPNNTTSDYLISALGSGVSFIKLPVGEGYLVEAVKFVTLNGVNKIVAYGTSTFTISDGVATNAPVSITEVHPLISFGNYTGAADPIIPQTSAVASTSIYPKTFSVVAADIVAPTTRANLNAQGLSTTWRLQTQTYAFKGYTSKFEKYRALASSSNTKFTNQLTPGSLEAGNLYAKGEFYLKPSLLKSGDLLFTYVYPDMGRADLLPRTNPVPPVNTTDYSDALLSLLLAAPASGTASGIK